MKGGFNILYKTHITTSVAAAAGIAKLVSFPFTIGYLGGVLLGALLPDIDEPNSYIGRRSFGLAEIIKQKYGHRGITHSLIFWIFSSILFMSFYNLFGLGITLGYLFHILGDYFSRSGVPLLLPLNKKRYKFFVTYKTSSTSENIILYIATFVTFILITDEKMMTPLIQSTVNLVDFVFRILLITLNILFDYFLHMG